MQQKRSFTQYFGTSFHDIANLKETQKRNAQVLLKAFDEWRATQLNYSKRIGQVANLISSLNKSKTGLYIIYQQLHAILSVLSVQSNNLARKIEDDIIIEFKQLVKKLNSQLGISVHMQKNSRKLLLSKKAMTEKVNNEYLTSKKAMEDNQVLNVLITNSCQSNLEKRLKQIQKTAECQKQFKLMDFKYREAVTEYNQQVAIHSTTVANILYKFQHQETELIKASHQSILKAILHLSTKHKTLSHEIDRISEEATQFSYSDCLESTAEKFANSPPSEFANVVFEPNVSFIGETIRMICDKTIDTLIQKCVILVKMQKNKILKQTIEKAIKSKDIEGLEDNSLKQFLGQFLAIIECSELQRLEKMKEMLKKIQNRAFFVGCLQQYRLIGKFVMSEKSITNLRKITMAFLDQCFQFKDAYLAKQVMALLFTYFYVNEEDPQKPKVYLQQLVRDHPLWESKEFWQSALLMCIYEERKNILNMNFEEKQMEVEAERNAVFNQLTCIPHNMVLFGFQEKDAKSFATKYAKLLHLGSRLKDIEKNIESADKVEKKSSSSSTKSPQMINKDSIRSENLPIKQSSSTKSLRQF